MGPGLLTPLGRMCFFEASRRVSIGFGFDRWSRRISVEGGFERHHFFVLRIDPQDRLGGTQRRFFDSFGGIHLGQRAVGSQIVQASPDRILEEPSGFCGLSEMHIGASQRHYRRDESRIRSSPASNIAAASYHRPTFPYSSAKREKDL